MSVSENKSERSREQEVSVTEREIATQPEIWRIAAARAGEVASLVPSGARIAVIRCGTSFHVSQAFAVARESGGEGTSDAFVASEFPSRRSYDGVAISRSGNTSEVAWALEAVDSATPTAVISAVDEAPSWWPRAVPWCSGSPMRSRSSRHGSPLLSWLSCERLWVTTSRLPRATPRVRCGPLPLDPEAVDHFVFLGSGWSVGLANEAALKLREIAGAWSEAYPAMEYRHGPMSVGGPRSAIWPLGHVPEDVLAEVEKTGATVVRNGLDPMAELVLAQRVAVAAARLGA